MQKLTNQVQGLNNFTLEDLNGRRYNLKALRGNPVLLDFWATWCPPCREEMPRLNALQKKGLTVLAITDENAEVARKFAAAHRYTFPILLDPHGAVFNVYGVVPRPTNILIDSSGRITARWLELPEDTVLQAALARAQ